MSSINLNRDIDSLIWIRWSGYKIYWPQPQAKLNTEQQDPGETFLRESFLIVGSCCQHSTSVDINLVKSWSFTFLLQLRDNFHFHTTTIIQYNFPYMWMLSVNKHFFLSQIEILTWAWFHPEHRNSSSWYWDVCKIVGWSCGDMIFQSSQCCVHSAALDKSCQD